MTSATSPVETRAKGGFAKAYQGLLANPIESVAQSDGRGRLPLAGRRWRDRGHEDQLAIGSIRQGTDKLVADFRLGWPIR